MSQNNIILGGIRMEINGEVFDNFYRQLYQKRIMTLSNTESPSIVHNPDIYYSGQYHGCNSKNMYTAIAVINVKVLVDLWRLKPRLGDVSPQDQDILVVINNGTINIYHTHKQKLNVPDNARVISEFETFREFLDHINYKGISNKKLLKPRLGLKSRNTNRRRK